MTDLTLESLGISTEEIIERVVERIAESTMQTFPMEEGRPHKSFASLIEDRVIERANAAIDEIAGRYVLPNVAAYVENLCLQETNKWGEKTGKSMTFVEYLVARAEAWIAEPVNYEGKTKEEGRGFSWHPAGTRIAFLIHQHLEHEIGQAMKAAFSDLNKSVAKGLHDTVTHQLSKTLEKLRVEVKA